MTGLARALLRRRGSPAWDAVLRGAGVAALVAIYPVTHWPHLAGLVGFFCLTLVVSSPLSIVLPAAFEPMLMVAGRLYPALLVTLVGVAGNLYMDYVNYHLYGAALAHSRLERARGSRIVQRTLALFQRSPFFAVWLCSWSPLPYWIVCTLAPLSRYPMTRFLFATFLGRAPRVWCFAALGRALPVSTQLLATAVAVALAIGLVVALRKCPRALFTNPTSAKVG
ncbi:MAG TPA: VTT domain-containing protein [Gemmatimonadales bacterium]|nr:VTT domain-containing protein [Gemmatimonadales bacterium]